MEDYEYKILRVPVGTWRHPPRFAKPDERAIALQHEARYGWTLFEVFDGWRIRLRRPVSARAKDEMLGGDPYNTTAVFTPGA